MNNFSADISELGVVQSASKIWEKISILRNLDEREKRKYSRRWIWELLQNAKDVSIDLVNVKIDYFQKQIIFSHDGKKFTCKDLLSLVTQTSFKEMEQEQATGKFGTGFITTHLICEKIRIIGLICDYDGRIKKLDFILDRSGKTRAEVQDLIKEQLRKIDEINRIDTVENEFENDFSTSFIYEIEESVADIVQQGINELFYCAPYVLAFVPKIKSISIIGQSNNTFRLGNIFNYNELFQKYTLKEQENSLMTYRYKEICLGITVKSRNCNSIVELNDNIPKIFCDFPLVGTEKFPLSTIVNSKMFDITEPRDGIMLGSRKNKELLMDYITAYKDFLKKLALENYENLYLLCKIGSSEDDWLQDNVLNVLKKIYRRIPIVKTMDGKLEAIEDQDGNVNILFPVENDSRIEEDIWDLCSCFNFIKKTLPAKEENFKWITVVREEKFKLNLNKIFNMINSLNTINELSRKFKKETNVISWINYLLEILNKKEALQNELARIKMIPNQNGDLCIEAQLKKDGNISNELKDILLDLGEDIRANLRDCHIVVPNEKNKEVLTNMDIASKIRIKVYELLQKENEPGAVRTEHTKKVFKKLIIWFSDNQQEAERIFSDLYEHKHKLYDDIEIIKNIQLSQEITKIMQDNGITEIQEIRNIIERDNSVEVLTESSLACMGIINEEEFERVFANEDIKTYFNYEKKPTPENFIYAQKIIQRAKKNVLEFLRQYPQEYDCSSYQETATTILAGIRKNGKPIKIVVRPSDGDKIYIYYQSELDTMDYEDYELWVDNNQDDPRQLTFGKLLKITGVKVIPLQKIFY